MSDEIGSLVSWTVDDPARLPPPPQRSSDHVAATGAGPTGWQNFYVKGLVAAKTSAPAISNYQIIFGPPRAGTSWRIHRVSMFESVNVIFDNARYARTVAVEPINSPIFGVNPNTFKTVGADGSPAQPMNLDLASIEAYDNSGAVPSPALPTHQGLVFPISLPIWLDETLVLLMDWRSVQAVTQSFNIYGRIRYDEITKSDT